MADEQINESIKDATEALIAPSIAIGMFLRQAFCVLVQQSGIDRNALLEDLKTLTPENDEDSIFKIAYDVYKEKFITSIDELP